MLQMGFLIYFQQVIIIYIPLQRKPCPDGGKRNNLKIDSEYLI